MTGPIDLARLRASLTAAAVPSYSGEATHGMLSLADVLAAVPALLDEVERLRAEVAAHIASLAECYRLSGADPDDDTDAMLAKHAVSAVRELREDYDADCGRPHV